MDDGFEAVNDAEPDRDATAACLVVPNGTHRAGPTIAALAQLHPAWDVGAIWCGDPHLRPVAADVRWWAAPSGPAWERMLTSLEPRCAEWWAALEASRMLLDRGAARVVLLWMGDVAVVGDLAPLEVPSGAPLTLVPRVVGRLPDDGAAPPEEELVTAGYFSIGVAVVDRAALGERGALGWLQRETAAGQDPARALELAAHLFGAAVCRAPAIGVGAWRWDTDAPALVDVPGFDPQRPWVLDPAVQRQARQQLVGRTEREAAMARAAPQLAGTRRPLSLPGAVVVDGAVRAVTAAAGQHAPAPWSDAAAYRKWLEPLYWPAVRTLRPDVAAAFADADGRDAPYFARWCREAFTVDAGVPFLLRHRPPAHPGRWEVADELRADGVNLVGYLARDFSLGDVARRLAGALEQAGIQCTSLPYDRSASPAARWSTDVPRIRHRTTVAVVTADQFPLLAGDQPELFRATERMIGYWFWELAEIPRPMRSSFRFVDEIWAPSTFVRDAIAGVARKPVHLVPLPVGPPVPSQRERGSFPPLQDAGQRFAFLVAFDHLSVTERKNPIGVIDAFTSAFAPDEGPLLLVKSINGHLRWPEHQRVLAAARHRPDIRVWDAHLPRDDQMALVAASDCMVSLHRSEGLGLHLAEAMWLGVPTIATRYSGNLDFMDDASSMLVDFRLVPVGPAGQGVYPPRARWADPDIGAAAAAMRSIVADGALATRLGHAGRQRMESLHACDDTRARLRDLLRDTSRQEEQ